LPHCGAAFTPRLISLPQQDVYEIKSALILEPGPAALTDGLSELESIIERCANSKP
jgi:iron complex transport system substrate-binding protein